MSKKTDNIRVMCRFRPPSERESSASSAESEMIYRVVDDSKKQVEVLHVDERMKGRSPHQFSFDHVFEWSASQKQVYSFCLEPLLSDVFEGYNATIFAYGQTGSGKTHSMMGVQAADGRVLHPEAGVIPRAVRDIWDRILLLPSFLEFQLKVSYCEIYNESLRDLIKPQKDARLQIRDAGDEIYVENLSEVYLRGEDEFFAVVAKASANRQVGATKMNADSSRSHAVLTLKLEITDTRNGRVKTSKLMLVDLAGSEKVKKTEATGDRLTEARAINKSLATLGSVMSKLSGGRKSAHIPYRDSTLTRLLSDSLGGNCRTVLLICCAPCALNHDETLSTCRFGERAKKVKNKPKKNESTSIAQFRKELQTAKKRLSLLYSISAQCLKELRATKQRAMSDTSAATVTMSDDCLLTEEATSGCSAVVVSAIKSKALQMLESLLRRDKNFRKLIARKSKAASSEDTDDDEKEMKEPSKKKKKGVKKKRVSKKRESDSITVSDSPLKRKRNSQPKLSSPRKVSPRKGGSDSSDGVRKSRHTRAKSVATDKSGAVLDGASLRKRRPSVERRAPLDLSRVSPALGAMAIATESDSSDMSASEFGLATGSTPRTVAQLAAASIAKSKRKKGKRKKEKVKKKRKDSDSDTAKLRLSASASRSREEADASLSELRIDLSDMDFMGDSEYLDGGFPTDSKLCALVEAQCSDIPKLVPMAASVCGEESEVQRVANDGLYRSELRNGLQAAIRASSSLPVDATIGSLRSKLLTAYDAADALQICLVRQNAEASDLIASQRQQYLAELIAMESRREESDFDLLQISDELCGTREKVTRLAAERDAYERHYAEMSARIDLATRRLKAKELELKRVEILARRTKESNGELSKRVELLLERERTRKCKEVDLIDDKTRRQIAKEMRDFEKKRMMSSATSSGSVVSSKSARHFECLKQAYYSQTKQYVQLSQRMAQMQADCGQLSKQLSAKCRLLDTYEKQLKTQVSHWRTELKHATEESHKLRLQLAEAIEGKQQYKCKFATIMRRFNLLKADDCKRRRRSVTHTPSDSSSSPPPQTLRRKSFEEATDEDYSGSTAVSGQRTDEVMLSQMGYMTHSQEKAMTKMCVKVRGGGSALRRTRRRSLDVTATRRRRSSSGSSVLPSDKLSPPPSVSSSVAHKRMASLSDVSIEELRGSSLGVGEKGAIFEDRISQLSLGSVNEFTATADHFTPARAFGKAFGGVVGGKQRSDGAAELGDDDLGSMSGPSLMESTLATQWIERQRESVFGSAATGGSKQTATEPSAVGSHMRVTSSDLRNPYLSAELLENASE